MSNDRTYRLWRNAKLQVPKKRPRRRAAASRPKATAPTGANQVWADQRQLLWPADDD
jgi:putative transposase